MHPSAELCFDQTYCKIGCWGILCRTQSTGILQHMGHYTMPGSYLNLIDSLHAPVKGEVSQEFGVISNTPKCLIINRNPKVLLKFDVNYHPSVLRLSTSVSDHRWTRLEWTAT